MIDLSEMQKRVLQNKINQDFNTTDIYMELCYAHGELTEVMHAYYRGHDNLGEEIADVAIYLLGLAEILGIDLEEEIRRKLDINEKRRYIQKDGVNIRVE